jgi:hypothetical protein
MERNMYELPDFSQCVERVIHRFLADCTSIDEAYTEAVSLRQDHILFSFGSIDTIGSQLPIRDYRAESLLAYWEQHEARAAWKLNPDPHGWNLFVPALISAFEGIIEDVNSELRYWLNESISLYSEDFEALNALIQNHNNPHISDQFGRAVFAPAMVEVVEVEMDDSTNAYYVRLLPEPDFIPPDIQSVYFDTIKIEDEPMTVLLNEALWYWERTVVENNKTIVYIAALTSYDHRLIIRTENEGTLSDHRYAYFVDSGYSQIFESDEVDDMLDWIQDMGFDPMLFC